MSVKHLRFILVFTVLCGSFHLFAQAIAPKAERVREGLAPLGELERVTRLLGATVVDPRNQRLGLVKDLAVDLQNGRLTEVIIETGKKTYAAAPAEEFAWNSSTRTLRLNLDAARFAEGPRFVLSDWDSSTRRESILDVCKYYGAKPYFADGDATIALGPVQRASQLIGSGVKNLLDEKVAKVENLLIDFPAARVTEVILGSGGHLGVDQKLSAIPPQSFRPGTDAGALALDTTKQALANAPHFKSADWTKENDAAQVSSVYKTYQIKPYFTPSAVNNTAQNKRDRESDALTPLRQGKSSTDLAMTREIRKAIIAARDLSVDAHNVKIITIDGHVTLRGPVKTEAEKKRIADLAEGVAASLNVDNQLQVEQPRITSNP